MKNQNKQEVIDFCKRFNLTKNQFYGIDKIGGSLDLSGLTSIPKEFNPTVGGYLYLSGHLTANTKPLQTNIISWCDKYIKVDGVFTEIINRKGNIFKVKDINSSDTEYWLVTDGKFTHAHGKTLKEAKEDFRFKQISDSISNS